MRNFKIYIFMIAIFGWMLAFSACNGGQLKALGDQMNDGQTLDTGSTAGIGSTSQNGTDNADDQTPLVSPVNTAMKTMICDNATSKSPSAPEPTCDSCMRLLPKNADVVGDVIPSNILNSNILQMLLANKFDEIKTNIVGHVMPSVPFKDPNDIKNVCFAIKLGKKSQETDQPSLSTHPSAPKSGLGIENFVLIFEGTIDKDKNLRNDNSTTSKIIDETRFSIGTDDYVKAVDTAEHNGRLANDECAFRHAWLSLPQKAAVRLAAGRSLSSDAIPSEIREILNNADKGSAAIALDFDLRLLLVGKVFMDDDNPLIDLMLRIAYSKLNLNALENAIEAIKKSGDFFGSAR